jgi:hypothetical protein
MTFRKLGLFPKRRVSTLKNTGRWKKVQIPSNSVCYTPSSEPFKIYLQQDLCNDGAEIVQHLLIQTGKGPSSRQALVGTVKNLRVAFKARSGYVPSGL